MPAQPAQPSPQGLSQTVRVIRFERRLEAGRLRAPQVDVQSLDLLDQQEDGFSRCAHVGTLVGTETRAPRTQLVELLLGQPPVNAGQSTTGGSALQPR